MTERELKLKRCNKCSNEYPANTDYYFKKHDTKDGFTSRCKVCIGKKFTTHLTDPQPSSGYKYCIKCKRELAVSTRFFPPDKLCPDGLRNVCRECGKDGHFMKEDYEPKTWWTEEDEKLLVEIYPHYLNEEIIDKFFPNETLKSLSDKIYKINKENNSNVHKTEDTMRRKHDLHSEKMSGENSPNYGKSFSDETKRKISLSRKGKYVGINSPLYGVKKSEEHKRKMSVAFKKLGKWKGENNPRHKNPLLGESNGRWEGGITPINHKIRNSDEYKKWRNLVFSRDNYTCQCCGYHKGKLLQAHHINNFSNNLDLRFDVNNGLTMCKDCHDPTIIGSFHHTYGTRDNNLDQLYKYIKNISWDIKARKIKSNIF